MSSNNEFVFKRYNGEWYIFGPSNQTGKIDIKKKDGSTESKELGEEIPCGMSYYKINQESIPKNVNYFKRIADKEWIVLINDGKDYKIGDKINVTTRKGVKEYTIKEINNNTAKV